MRDNRSNQPVPTPPWAYPAPMAKHAHARTSHARPSIVPALLIEEPRVLAGIGTRTDAETPRNSLGSVLGLIRPLWAFLAYDVVMMALKLAHVTPPGHVLEIACAAATLWLFWGTLRARSRGAEFAHEDLADFRKTLAANSLSWIGVQTMFVYMIAFVQQRFPGLDGDGAGRMLSTSFLALNAVAAMLPAFVLLPLSRSYGVVVVHSVALATMAAGYAAGHLFAATPAMLYLVMAFMGIGWAAIVSLPFSIMSQSVDPSRIGLYMGVFNLSIVLPQLVVSLGVGSLVEAMDDKGGIFLIGAASLALSALAWRSVALKR